MATRKEVADKAGVSVATVSYVMNNKQGVSEETRARVWQAITELEYKPSYAARSLKIQKSNNLAVFINYLGDPFEAGLLNHLEERAREAGYFLNFQTFSSETEIEFRHQFAGRVDGLLLIGQTLQAETLQTLRANNLPIVSITQAASDHSFDAIADIDWEMAMYQLLTHLYEQGHRRIAFMENEHYNHPHHYRKIAFVKAMERLQLTFNEQYFLQGGGRLEQAQQQMYSYLRASSSEKFTAFVAASDLMAIGMLTACRQLQIAVPEELAICGCENILMTTQTEPEITTIHYPRKEVAYAAVDLISKLLQQQSAPSYKISTELVLRKSTIQQVSLV
ncbi:LacI family DNA-binding transcriptional regulator [Paenibacillus yanchengensis]|uniref:LacI family DNA-binding transcriptional regulator n=1 Tax=Paenibacillus yanchengensis TaxID=2035833 RepID=A0ABW4YIA2_9BACL